MDYYELFKESPGAFFLILILSLAVTLVTYCAFPLIFAKTRKKQITAKTYKKYCYIVNIIVAVIFKVVNGDTASSFGPYLLWTWVFSRQGEKILNRKGLLTAPNEAAHNGSQNKQSNAKTTRSSDDVSPPAEHFIPEQADTRHSLSEVGEQPKRYGNWNVPAKDLALETAEEITPVSTELPPKTILGRNQALIIDIKKRRQAYIAAAISACLIPLLILLHIIAEEIGIEAGLFYVLNDICAFIILPIICVGAWGFAIYSKVKNRKSVVGTIQRYCQKCGGSINTKTKKCAHCGKQYYGGITKIVILLSILAIILTAALIVISAKNRNENSGSNNVDQTQPYYMELGLTYDQYKLASMVAYDVDAYCNHMAELKDMVRKGTYGEDLKKEKVADYLNNNEVLDYGEKIILYRFIFPYDSEYNSDIVDYLNGRDDISYDEMVFILEELGFAVFEDGTVKW